MLASRKIAAIVLGVGVAAAGAGALLAPSFAQSSPPTQAGQSGGAGGAPARLTIAQVHDKLEKLGYTRIDKIELERGAFEVKAAKANATREKLYVDAFTGEILKSKPRRRDD
ncbi:MAG: PepSY domain-containing protein [Burkholderiaceae bacterium]|nr:PepSY domain-containing protein [Burkholderiaceae bacterium]